MPGGLVGALARPTAALHRAATGDGNGAPVTTPRLPARHDAERELSRPEYHEHDPNFFQRALNWLWDRLTDLLSTAAGVAPGGWVGLTVLALLLVLLLIALRIRLGNLRPTPTTGTTPLFTNRPADAADHRAAAEAHAAAGHWSAAVQERMRALVRSLEERALLDPRPGRTADEAAAEAGTVLTGQADQLRAAARTFDEVTYAGRAADQTAYTLLRDLDHTLLHTTPAQPTALSSPGPADRGGPA
ncbi:DUF4129 domain-containing protein [Streptomyces sp. 891-h]|uniref:DUF4129 domain-containing protein n=1 Tax=Streptomyces sp. 891-h TaxID=2720714 RepID=UPI001FAB2FFF|nr:DUF4129 domain-containing protein [Streptomyces sp. 891-h]UNZ19036.1 DUF4129 domain-containing protein [Streptomyces sp. 891-h]